MKIGCTTRPFRNEVFAEACRRIAAAGYSDVAVFFDVGIDAGSPPGKVMQVRNTASDHGLVPSMLLVHSFPERPDAAENYRRVIDNAAALGASWILDLGASDRSLRVRYIELVRSVVAHAREAGIRISLKPHGGITSTSDDLISIYQAVDHPAFGICFDPGNIIYYSNGMEMPEDSIAEVAPLVTTGIIKDCVIRDGKPDVMITPGEGLVNFEAVLGGLVRGGFDGPLYTECVGGTSAEEITQNVRCTREWISGLVARF